MSRPDVSYYETIDQPDFPKAECIPHPLMPWVEFGPVDKVDMAQMVRLCDACVHMEECLLFAMLNPAILGVWGGTTTAERASMRRTQRAYLSLVDRSA